MRDSYLPFGRPDLTEAEIDAVARVMRSGWIGMGHEVLAFETELAAYAGAKEAVAVSSCTAALFLALKELGVGPGDEVIVPSYTWCSSANAALYLGARPVFCDIDAETYNVTAATITAKLSPRTKAVVVVHIGGLAAPVEAIAAALPPGLAIVEDAAHAIGAFYANGQPVGSSGNMVCFSFYANKNLTSAEGGAILLNDADAARRLRSWRLHGLDVDAWARFTEPKKLKLSGLSELGYKMNFTDLQAAIARVQLARLPEMQAKRLLVAQTYARRLAAAPLPLRPQHGLGTTAHAHHLALTHVPFDQLSIDRDGLLVALRAQNLGATIHYAPLHAMPLYGQEAAGLPVTADLGRNSVSLPMSATMLEDDAHQVADALISILAAA